VWWDCPARAAGSGLDPEALLAFARENLAAYKVPRRVAVVDELPRSLIGKVLRREIRDTLVAGR
jgi:long-chain acyl-CoA synthetase